MYIGEFNMDKITLSANKINVLCIAIWCMYNTRIDGKPLTMIIMHFHGLCTYDSLEMLVNVLKLKS